MVDTKFRRSALILGVLIAVLAATYALGLVFSPTRVEKRRAQTPLLADLDTEAVASIRIADAEGVVQMARKDGNWAVDLIGKDYPASASRVKVLLDFLAEVKRIRTATENPELWKDFGVGNDAPHRLTLQDAAGRTVLELVIGNQEMSLSGDYVRVEGRNEVLLSDRSFSYYTGTGPSFWSELRILPEGLQGQEIVRLTVNAEAAFGTPAEDAAAGVSAAAARYTLRLSDEKPGTWVVDGQPGVTLDPGQIERLMNDLAGIQANEFAVGVNAEAAGLGRPRGQIVFSTSQGRDYRLLIGQPAGEKQHYVGLEGSEYIYSVAEWRLQNVVKPLEELQSQAGQ